MVQPTNLSFQNLKGVLQQKINTLDRQLEVMIKPIHDQPKG